MTNLKTVVKKSVILLVVVAIAAAQIPAKAFAAPADYQQATVSFTFDDGFESAYQNAAPILKNAGYAGTMYYITGVGDKTYQNGKTDDGKAGMTWAQVQDLQNNYGWEIGSHTVNHGLMSKMTDAQVDAQLADSKTALMAHGITEPTDFAFPEGDYLNPTLVQTAKYYQSSRGFQDVGLDTYPYSKIVIYDESLDANMTLAQAEALVDQAIANKQWLVFTGHGIEAQANPNYAYIWKTADFQSLVNYVKSKNVPVKLVRDLTKNPGQILTKNASFEDSASMSGWLTDDTTNVTVDTNNNGSYPSAQNSVKVTGTTTGNHLFSDLISVVPGHDYLLDAFVNALNFTAGELGFYMDEYDANGNWISGQWLGMVTNSTIGFFDKVINTTSDLVSSFRIQTYTTANSTGFAYLDNLNLFDLSATESATPTVTPTPSVSVTPSAAPAQNIMTNGDFSNGSTNWTNDNAAQVAISDKATLTGGVNAVHLFYSLLPIDPAAQYMFSAVADATGLTAGEAGYYIDEYNSAGTWISGQWLGKVTNGLASTFERLYKATSTAVAQVRVQTYLTANSAGTVTTDNYSLANTASGSATPTATPSGTVTPTPTGSASGNMIANGDFANGLSNGWTTDSANVVTQAQAILMQGSANAAHLFYGLLPVDSTAHYLLSAVADATNLTAGELGFYMDEYDANGNWISGQWLGQVANGVVSTFSHAYTATSTAVKQVRVQTYLTANSAGSATVDNYSLTNQAAGTTPTPTVTGTPTGTPSATPTPGANLVTNNSFESATGGFATDWTRDGVNVALDTASNGNDGINSLHITPDAAYGHAFSSLISVNPTSTYTWNQYIKTVTGTGEFGFYIDEYDAAGNWISGQWKGMLNAAYTGAMTFPYTPTSANVAKVRLQYYVVPNSTFDLFLDSVSLTSN